MAPLAALRQFKRTRQFPVAGVWQRAGRPGARCRSGPGHLAGEPHDVDHLVAALAALQHLKSQGRVRDSVEATLRFMYPDSWEGRLAQLRGSGFRPVSRSGLMEFRVRFDIACMLANRQWYRSHGPAFRYLTADASPQRSQSYEVFLAAERVICRAAVFGRTQEQVLPADFVCRVLPISTLGQGRTDLRNKVHALVHQTWLEYGPDAGSLRSANADVRQVLTDMGVEFGLADHADVVDEFLRGRAPVGAAVGSTATGSGQHLFPLALQVPGTLHLLDWVVKYTVEALPFWSQWLADSKRILQHLHSHNHRQWMGQFIGEHAGDTEAWRVSEMLASLQLTPGRFAQWRWKTLHRAVVDMWRAERALRFVFEQCAEPAKLLAIRDGAVFAALQTAVRNPDTWHRCMVIRDVVDRVTQFSSWLQGCACHDHQLRAGQAVRCPFKGCRALGVAAEVREVLGNLRRQRSDLAPGMYGAVPVEFLHACLLYTSPSPRD